MKEPVWVLREVVFMSHEQSLAEFGGAAGIRDEGLLDSALNKPQNLFAYEKPTLFEMAASYAFGIVKNHPFIDGNKRTGFVVAVTFLQINGWRLEAGEVDATLRTLALAAGEMSEAAYAEWLQANCKRLYSSDHG
ncbi:type II toxin-antitoxin system death-on-curing family toxin [Oscillatoria laete-virens NRMC-F 0139]|nr:type II toxin-antitoxin system death-on-curing family toxin [Oscillatoria laete-virens]MDL5054792.1 type II toxin-antitoxin system death-on-curing family toxin [Oscillatoria laete-virens NRMC-F 0139]